MKNTLLALFALSSVSLGATLAEIDTTDTNLKTYWNFDSSNALTAGSISWSELPTWNSAGYGESLTTSTHPFTNAAGLKAADGFTVSFDINNAQNGTLLSMSNGNMSQAWRSISITLNKNVISAQFLGTPATAVSETLSTEQLTSEWTTLTLVGSVSPTAASTLILDFYVNGLHKGTSTTENATNITGDNVINKMQFGYFGNSANGAPTNYDNILIYNRALTASEVKELTVPEPTTATLSLLALAGLAARRRRK